MMLYTNMRSGIGSVARGGLEGKPLQNPFSPNCVLHKNAVGYELRKAAGILSELTLTEGRVEAVVIGIGLNIAVQPQGLVDGRDLSQSATSLNAAAGREIVRGQVLRTLLEQLDRRYLRLQAGEQHELFTAWRARLAMLGQLVRVRRADDLLEGYAEDVEPSGALRLRDAHGTLHTITAGDVEA